MKKILLMLFAALFSGGAAAVVGLMSNGAFATDVLKVTRVSFPKSFKNALPQNADPSKMTAFDILEHAYAKSKFVQPPYLHTYVGGWAFSADRPDDKMKFYLLGQNRPAQSPGYDDVFNGDGFRVAAVYSKSGRETGPEALRRIFLNIHNDILPCTTEGNALNLSSRASPDDRFSVRIFYHPDGWCFIVRHSKAGQVVAYACLDEYIK
ncbi:MAG: hypothetical protein PHW69_01775 [Elusimicrobiaceae bacterium]|nr:hypothetical protein [Elusimicrobiaceae bacterium]